MLDKKKVVNKNHNKRGESIVQMDKDKYLEKKKKILKIFFVFVRFFFKWKNIHKNNKYIHVVVTHRP